MGTQLETGFINKKIAAQRRPPAGPVRRTRRVTRAMEHKLIEPLLLTPEECAAVLGIGPETFYRHAPQIVARHGLMPVVTGKVKKYSYDQLRAIVGECVRTGEPLYDSY